MEKLKTTTEVGMAFGVSGETVRQWVKDGLPVAVKLKRQMRIRMSDARRFHELRVQK